VNRIFSTLISTARAKITPLWTKIRFLTSASWWRTKGVTALRRAFSKLFDIKPRHQRDYYGIGRWLVSKRLAFSLVIALLILGFVYIFIMSPSAILSGDGGSGMIRTYKYNAIPLKFYEGVVNILAKGEYIAYTGHVSGGEATGDGTLYDRNGQMVYEGDFANCMFNGSGKQYYPSGALRYNGQFTDNLYNGTGSYYRESGVEEYVGEHTMGQRNGAGTLYNSGGNAIFSGQFQMNEIAYSQFVGKTTEETALMYTGALEIYSTSREYCVAMQEIGAAYTVTGGGNSLDEDWIVSGVCVLDDGITIQNSRLTTLNELTQLMGQPIYMGSTWVNLTEAVSVNMQIGAGKTSLPRVPITATSSIDGVYDVTEYDEAYELYIYTYSYGDLIYTFYSDGSTATGFFMYAIEMA